jgi:hypothetical protein
LGASGQAVGLVSSLSQRINMTGPKDPSRRIVPRGPSQEEEGPSFDEGGEG